MNTKINIVIIDTGISEEHLNDNVKGISLVGGVESYDIIDRIGHGTAIYNIIKKEIPNANFFIIKIRNSINDEVSQVDLENALEYIINNINADIVNISQGLNCINNDSKLYDLCEYLKEMNTIIVSAFDNDGAIAYPAAFKNVIGVTNSTNCLRNIDFEFISNNEVNIAANGNIQRVIWLNGKHIFITGDSFACAHVSTHICKLIENKKTTFASVMKHFESNYSKANEKKIEKPIWLNNIYKFKPNNVALFPYCKEISSLLRFQHLLPFNIADVYCSRHSFYVGSSVRNIMDNYTNDKDFIIKSIDKIDWDSIDMLVIGHLDKLSSAEQNSQTKLIDEALKKEKKIFSLDVLFDAKYDYKNIYFPYVTKEALPNYNLGKLYKIPVPVLAVLGTSPNQGKFTLQLTLRDKMQRLGYDIGQISTEPTGELFGMDLCFPMGYNSSTYIHGDDIIRFINYKMNEMALKQKELIIAGSQSGTLTYNFSNIREYNIDGYSFMMAVNPDAVILVVNPFDDITYIKNTVKFIESSSNCDVIAIVVFPLDYVNWEISFMKAPISDKRYQELKSALKKATGKTVYLLGTEHDENLIVKKIIEYFSE